MAVILHFTGDHGNTSMPLHWDIEVHNRAELGELVKDLRNASYRSFKLKTDEQGTVVEMDEFGIEWYNLAGFRP